MYSVFIIEKNKQTQCTKNFNCKYMQRLKTVKNVFSKLNISIKYSSI